MLNYSIILVSCICALACSEPAQLALPDSGGDLAISARDSQATDSQAADAGTPTAKIANLTVSALAKMPSILEAKWETSQPCTGQVLFGLTSAYGLTTPLIQTPGLAHRVLLKGIPASSDIFLKVTAIPTDGSPPVTIKHKARTGVMPSGLPTLTLGKNVMTKSSGGYTLFPILGDMKNAWYVIVDSHGRYVWWEKIPNGMATSVHVSQNRKAVVALEPAPTAITNGKIVRMPMDGEPSTTIMAPGIHTDFVEISPEKYAALGWEERAYENGKRKLLGDTILEVSNGGTVKVVWNVFDDFKPDLKLNYPKGGYYTDPTVEDWSHFNFLYYDAKQQSYYVSAGGGGALQLVAKISQAKGRATWSLGALSNTQDNITTVGGSSLVEGPHSVQRLAGDRILVFNRGQLGPNHCSNATEIHVDEVSKKATKKWSYESAACHMIYFLGNAERLWNGNTLVGWSTSGHLEEVTSSGEVVWSLRAGLGTGFGFVERVKSLYLED